jgi:hypothetical protein
MDEHLEDGARLLVDETGDALHTSTASETGGGCGGLGEAMPWISLPFVPPLPSPRPESQKMEGGLASTLWT